MPHRFGSKCTWGGRVKALVLFRCTEMYCNGCRKEGEVLAGNTVGGCYGFGAWAEKAPKVDPKLFTYDIKKTENYDDYMSEFSDEFEEPWDEDGVPYKIWDHICEPFCLKNGRTKWPTCSSNEDGFCKGEKLPGMVRVCYMTYFQDHEWYNDLMDRTLKDEALEQKAIYEESWGEAKQSALDQNVKEEVKDTGFVVMEEVTFDQIMDEVDSKTQGAQENDESPFDTESKIKIIKSYQAATISGLLFIHQSSSYDQDQNVINITPKDAKKKEASESLSSLRFMPDDDLTSLSGFEIQDATYYDSQEGTAKTFHAFADKPAQSDPFGYLQEELNLLNNKDSIKTYVSESITEELPKVDAQVEKNLEAQLPDILLKSMYKEFNAFNKLESQWFDLLQKALSKSLHTKMRKSIKLKDLLKPEEQQKSLHEFTDHLFGTTSLKFSPTPPREPTPLRDPAIGEEVAFVKKQVNELVTYQEEGGFIPKMPKTKSFTIVEATMKITRGGNPLNLVVHPNSRIKTLGFSECLDVHALASKKSGKSNNMLLQSLRAKFQWVIDQAKKLRLPQPPALATLGLTTEDHKRKRTKIIKEVFVTENITVDGMHRNLIFPSGVVPIDDLVITKPE
nr:hypothetical protein [Tanacetum cinerariifolium]